MALLSALFLIGALATSFLSAQKLTRLALERSCISRHSHAKNRGELFARLKGQASGIPCITQLTSKISARRKAEALQRELPEAVRLLCVSLESGASLEMALRYAANNCADPLAEELKRTIWDLEAGHSFNEALEKLRKRTRSAEFAFLAVAMEIQHQTGGSFAPILDNLAGLLKQTAELKEDLQTKTAQGRLSSRIVAVMPFLLLAVLSLFSPGYLISFFTSPLGICLFVLALVFEAVGILLVKRCLAVDFTVDFEGAV